MALHVLEKHCRIDTRGDWAMAAFFESRPRPRSQIDPRPAVSKISQIIHYSKIALSANLAHSHPNVVLDVPPALLSYVSRMSTGETTVTLEHHIEPALQEEMDPSVTVERV